MPAAPLVLLDFDGTLAWREGLWSGCMLEVLDALEPGHGLRREQIRAAMHGRYPWSTPEQPHPHLCDGEQWWREMQARMAAALERGGIAGGRAAELARAARERFIDPAVGWRLFDDTLPALDRLRAAGRRIAVLSNHVPELAQLAAALGLADRLDAIFTSALTGFEKPHPEAFATALRALAAEPAETWMVGDNPHADAAGAEALGIRAIVVRGRPGPASRRAPGLREAAALILADERATGAAEANICSQS